MGARKAKSNKAVLNLDAMKEILQRDEDEIYVEELKDWLLALLAENKADRLPREVVALEGLFSVFDAFQKGLDHERIKASYPLKSWREETAVIPIAWLRLFVEAWGKYVKSGPEQKFGEFLHLEGGGQGISPSKRTLAELKEKKPVERGCFSILWPS